MKFDPNKVLNVFTVSEAKKGGKAFMDNSLLKLKDYVENEKLGHLFKLDGIGYKKGKYDSDDDKDIGDAIFRVKGDYSNDYYKFIYPVNEDDILPINFRTFENDYDKIGRPEKLKFKTMKDFRTVYYPEKEDEKVACIFVIYYNMAPHPYLIKAPNEEVARSIVGSIRMSNSPDGNAKYLYLGKTSKGSTKKVLEQFDPEIVKAYNLEEAKVVSASDFLKKHEDFLWLPEASAIEEPVYAAEISTSGIFGRRNSAVPHDYSLKVKWEKLLAEKGISSNCKLYEEEIDTILGHPEWEAEIFQTIFERFEAVEKYKDKWLKTVEKFYPENSRAEKSGYDIYRSMVDYKANEPFVEFERRKEDLFRAHGMDWKDVNTPWMPKSLIAYIAKPGYLNNEGEYYPDYYEGNSIGFIYKTPIPMKEALNLPVAHATDRECVCAKLNKNFIYATNRSEEHAVTPPELSGLRLFHFVEDYKKEHDDKFPFLTRHQVIALSEMDNYYERCDDWKVYSAYEISVKHLTPLTKVPNTLKVGLWVEDIGYDPEYKYQTPTGRWICNYLKELNLHPIAGTYNEYTKQKDDYSKANCELIVGLNEEGKDYSFNYSKEFWDQVCFNDNEKIIIKSNKMNEYL